ncbi:histidine kinase [bacterium]|nr:histidine kinase [bacterium]
MSRCWLCFFLLFVSLSLEAANDHRPTSILEARKATIENELDNLSRPSLRGGVGAIGYHSTAYDTAEHPFSVEIRLGGEYLIDQVVLVPILWRDVEQGFRADAFPELFRVVGGTGDDLEGKVLAEYHASEGFAQGITPVVLDVEATKVSWIRIEGPRLTIRTFDGRYVFQMSEIMVFSGGKNVALHKPIQTSLISPRDPSGAWNLKHMVDGITPYIMNSARGSQSLGFIGDFGARPVLLIDLEDSYFISGIHLHAVEQGNTVPQAYFGDLGIPRKFRIEGSETQNFEDPVLLLDCELSDRLEVGPIMMWNIPEVRCRYVRIVSPLQESPDWTSGAPSRVGFTEVELISDGRNVATGKKAWVEPEMKSRRDPLALTDGQNYYGEILPFQVWLNELSRRAELELELSVLDDELSSRYTRQKKILQLLGWSLLAALFLVVFVALYGRMLRIRNEARVRERIAANLHDEFGANLHAIGMWSDIAQDSIDSPESLSQSLQKIRGLTERTGASARFCANMLEARGVCEDLVDEMKREASRLLADISYDLSFESEEAINALSRRQRIDIFLFFKESLTNILRHGQATGARISLSLKSRQVELIIADDGCGFSGGLPKSLQRRAKLMRAKAGVEQPEVGGTIVWLKLKAR